MTVSEFMAKSHIPLHYNGYDYVKRAIELKVANPEWNMSKIKLELSIKLYRTDSAIERGIITAIHKGFPNMDSELRNIIFPNLQIEPTTNQYISSVAYAISHNMI